MGAETNMERLIRLKEVTARTGLEKSTVYDLIADGEFPKPIPLTKRTVAWIESEVQAWIEKRIAAARSPVKLAAQS